jgi:hypothetical protein
LDIGKQKVDAVALELEKDLPVRRIEAGSVIGLAQAAVGAVILHLLQREIF